MLKKNFFLISLISIFALGDGGLSIEGIENLPVKYSKKMSISDSISKIKEFKELLSKTSKREDIGAIVQFMEIRIDELEEISKLPATQDRTARINDISQEILEVNFYIKKVLQENNQYKIASNK
jgi:hypothetical protein